MSYSPYTLLYVNELTFNAIFWLEEAISERMVDIGKQDMRNQTDSKNYVVTHDFLLFFY